MVSAADLKLFKTLNGLGGAITATAITSGSPNNAFTNVPNNERVIGEDYYACVFLKNAHASENMNNFKLWLSDKSFPHDTQIKWGFDPVANKSISFDGVTGWVDLGNDATLWSTSLTKFSVSVWLYPTAIAAGVTRGVWEHGIGNYRCRCFFQSATSEVTFLISNATNTVTYQAKQSITINQWNQVVCVYDNSLGSANVKIYVNGVVGATTANFTDAINASATMKLADSSNDFKGFMRDFIFWKTVPLSQTDIDNLYAGNDDLLPDYDYRLMTNEGAGYPHDSVSTTKLGIVALGAKWNADAFTIADKYTAPVGVIWQGLGGTPQNIPTVPARTAYRNEPYETFDGVSSGIISIADAPEYNLSQFTIACWFRTSKTYVVETGGGEGIMIMKGGFGTSDAAKALNYGMWVTDANHLRGGFEGPPDVEYLAISSSPNILVNDGLWHHACTTYDLTSVRLYLDGVQVRNVDTTVTPATSTIGLRIGRNPLDERAGYYEGDLDEVYIWNTALTPTEVLALASSGAIAQPSAVVYSNSFGTDTGPTATANVGALKAGSSIPIWLWYHVDANAVSRLDDSELFGFSFDIPTGGTGSTGGGNDEGGSGGTGGNPPPATIDYKIAVSGDWGCESVTDDVLDLMKTYNWNIGVGDMAYASPGCWIDRFTPIKSYFDSAMGNHEYPGGDGGLDTYKAFFGYSKTYLSFQYQNFWFLIMDTNISFSSGSAQYNFVTAELARVKDDASITWRAVVFHHPMFGADSDHTYNDGNFNQTYQRLFQDNKINFVFTGHNHNWQRTYQVVYNSGDPESPTVVGSASPYSAATKGLIHVISGAGGHDSPDGSGASGKLYSLASQPSFQAYQSKSHNGVWEAVASNAGKTLTCSFVDTQGRKYDTFTINA